MLYIFTAFIKCIYTKMNKFQFIILFFLALFLNPLFANPFELLRDTEEKVTNTANDHEKNLKSVTKNQENPSNAETKKNKTELVHQDSILQSSQSLDAEIAGGYRSVNLDLYSMQELYPPCKASRLSGFISIELGPLTPENYKSRLIHMMCNSELVVGSGSPGQQKKFRVKFELLAQEFLNNVSSKLPSCNHQEFKDNCLGQGLAFNGFYVGEWANNVPHGQGIQLLTDNPPFGFSNVFAGIYEGAFSNGLFSGKGYYQTSSLEESFDGNWMHGQMHGFINWVWPKVYKFGISFSRDPSSSYIIIDNIEPFGAAEMAGLKVGDIVKSLQSDAQMLDTSQNGISTIGLFLSNTSIDQEILFSLFGNTEEDLKTLSVSKTQVDPIKAGIFSCADTPHGQCFRDAQYKNEFNRKGFITRGSYMMGFEHAYQPHDFQVEYTVDGQVASKGARCWSHSATPFNVFTQNKELRQKFKLSEKGGGLEYMGESLNDVCPSSFLLSPSQLLFPELLIGDAQAIDNIATKFSETTEQTALSFWLKQLPIEDRAKLFDANPWLQNKYDIADFLNDVMDIRDSGNKIPRDHPIHLLCGLAEIDSMYCENNPSTLLKYETYISKRVSRTPGTKAYERRKSYSLIRAKENFAIIAMCSNKNYQTSFHLDSCIGSNIQNQISYWKCINVYGLQTCAAKDRGSLRSAVVPVFRAENKEMLDAIDYNDWIFGDFEI